MKFNAVFALIALCLGFGFNASADVKIEARSCTNASRGLVLLVPKIALGRLTGPLEIKRLNRTLVSIAPASVSNLQVSPDGKLFGFDGADQDGTHRLNVRTAYDSADRLVIEVLLKDDGLIGFACRHARAD